MNRLAPMMSSARGDWVTPEVVLERVRRVDHIALDPCTTRDNPTRAFTICVERGPLPDDHDRIFVDGLGECSWADILDHGKLAGLTYVNSPYGRQIGRWIDRCVDEAGQGLEIIALVPARPDTRWWCDCTPGAGAQAVCFWRGRLTFVGAPSPAPFPSALVYWGARKYRFADAFCDVGAIWI